MFLVIPSSTPSVPAEQEEYSERTQREESRPQAAAIVLAQGGLCSVRVLCTQMQLDVFNSTWVKIFSSSYHLWGTYLFPGLTPKGGGQTTDVPLLIYYPPHLHIIFSFLILSAYENHVIQATKNTVGTRSLFLPGPSASTGRTPNVHLDQLTFVRKHTRILSSTFSFSFSPKVLLTYMYFLLTICLILIVCISIFPPPLQ